MRVSFLGKGGSGKTTLVTAFTKYVQAMGKNVVAVDADVNSHLGDALGLDSIVLEDKLEGLANYFEKDRKKDEQIVMIGTTPPDYTTKFIKADLEDPFFKEYATRKDNLALLTVGKYTDSSIGTDCYHSKLGQIEIVYNRLLDDDDMVVVTDSTAGIDSVGTQMFAISDINVFVVEPTKKSIQVFKDFEKLTAKYKLNNYVVANKVMDEEDKQYIIDEIGKENILGYIGMSKHLKRFEQGDMEQLDAFLTEIEEVNERIYDVLSNTKRDWNKYYNTLVDIYAEDCMTWYNDYYGKNLTEYINPNFNYNEVISRLEGSE